MRTSSGERFNRFKFTCAHKTLPFGTRLRVTNAKTGKAVVVRVSDRGPFRHQRIIDLAEVAARPLGIIAQGAADVVAQIVPSTTPLGPSATPANLLAIQAADPNPAAAFATYELPSAADSALVAATLAVGTPTAQPATAVAAVASATPDTLPGSPLLVVRPAARFLVQAGAFADAQNAHALRERLLALDPALPVELREELVEGQALTRVLIGQLDSWLAAEAVRRRLQAKSIAGLVRQLPSQPVVAAVAGPPAAP
jgi:rare lipoprotein A